MFKKIFVSLLLCSMLLFFPNFMHLVTEAATYFNTSQLSSVKLGRSSVIMVYNKIDDNQRLCVEIDNEIYYSTFGAGSKFSNETIVEYPTQPIGKEASIWLETREYEMSDIYEKSVKECEIEIGTYWLSTTPTTLSGALYISSGFSEYVIVNVGNQEYKGEVIYLEESISRRSNNYFMITYPTQEYETPLTITAYDSHGCASQSVNYTITKYSIEKPMIYKQNILGTRVYLENSMISGRRLCIKAGDKIYYSDYSQNQYFEYPLQEVGTELTFWIETNDGHYSEKVKGVVYDRGLTLKDANYLYPDSMNGVVQYNNSPFAPTIINASAKINKKVYEAVIIDGKSYTITFPQQKIGTKVTVTVSDGYGYTATREFKIQNTPIALNLNNISYGNETITGETVPESDITVTIAKKTYTGKSDEKGKFSIRIPVTKVGTKVTVKSIAPNTCHNTVSTNIKEASSRIYIDNTLYKNSTKIKVNCINIFKGDTIEIYVGNKSYTKKITANAASKSFTINIDKATVGTGVIAVLYDKYETERDYAETKIYLGDKISVGMSEKQVVQTTWGEPVRRNNYNGLHQWVFKSGYQTLYVYLQGGKVTSLQSFNY